MRSSLLHPEDPVISPSVPNMAVMVVPLRMGMLPDSPWIPVSVHVPFWRGFPGTGVAGSVAGNAVGGGVVRGVVGGCGCTQPAVRTANDMQRIQRTMYNFIYYHTSLKR